MKSLSSFWGLSIIFVSLVLAGCMSFAGSAEDTRKIITAGLSFEFNRNTGKINDFKLPGNAFASAGNGGIYFIDGKTGRMFIPDKIEMISSTDKEMEYRIPSSYDKLDFRVKADWSSGIVKWTVSIENRGDEAAFMEVRLGLPLVAVNKLSYWDGINGTYCGYRNKKGRIIEPRLRTAKKSSNMYSHASNPSMKRPNADMPGVSMPALEPVMLGVFPLNLLYSKNIGVAIGANPDFMMSYYAGGVQPIYSPHESFYYALKYVIQPGKTETQGFVLFAFEPDGFGYRPAMEKFYESFPERYQRRKDLDRKVLKVGSSAFRNFLDVNEMWQEYARRHYFGYVWFYIGHLKTGEFWPVSGPPEKVEEYCRKNVAGIRMMQKGCKVAYYNIPHRCEINMARSKLPDAEALSYNDAHYVHGCVKQGEVITTMYPWGNSYGEHLKKDLWNVIEKGGAEALAFDNCLAPEMHFGSGVENSSGAAFITRELVRGKTWDTSSDPVSVPKAYAPIYLGYAHLMEYLRDKVRKEGKQVAFIGNNALALPTATRIDAAYFEWHWHPPLKRVGFFEQYRFMLGGNRPISYKISGRWKKNKKLMNGNILNQMAHQRKYSLLFCFRYGAYPTMRKYMGSGDPDCMDALPTLEKICYAGWQAVPAVRHDDSIWVERFGRDRDVYLSVINPESKDYKGKIKLVNKYLDGKGYRWFYSEYGDQKKVSCKSYNGITEIPVSIPATWVNVYASNLFVEPENKRTVLSGSVQSSENEISLNIKSSATTSLKVKAIVPEASSEAKVVLGNRILPSSMEDGYVSFTVPGIRRNKAFDIRISWRPQMWLADKKEILTFPFLKGDKPGCKIVAQKEFIDEAEALRIYFNFWRLQEPVCDWTQGKRGAKLPSSDSVENIPVVENLSGKGGNFVVIGDRDYIAEKAKAAGIELSGPDSIQKDCAAVFERKKASGQFLFVVLPHGKRGRELMDKFLFALDEKYPTVPGYDVNYGKRRGWDEKGLLKKSAEGQPIMGWHEFLTWLVEEKKKSDENAFHY